MPYFKTSNLEFNVLNNNFFKVSDVKYDKYFSPCDLSKLASSTAGKTDLFFLHFNVRRLSKNKDKVEKFLESFYRLPKVISISETKLNPNSVSNINIPNYTFIRNNSLTCASGVGLYIKNNMQYPLRTDLSLNIQSCEDLWLEIESKNYFSCDLRSP